LQNTKSSKVDRGKRNTLSNYVFKLNCPTLKSDQQTRNINNNNNNNNNTVFEQGLRIFKNNALYGNRKGRLYDKEN